MPDAKLRNVTDEELEQLAEAYLKLKNNKTYQQFSKTFQEYINEFLLEELTFLTKLRKVN